jgi:hypothetical protein
MIARRPLALLLALCLACTASAREKAIASTLATTDAARVAFVTFDANYQQGLLAKATDKPTLDKQLADYRGKQAKVEAAFALAYRAIAAAATVNSDASLSGMVSAALILSQSLHDLGVQ